MYYLTKKNIGSVVKYQGETYVLYNVDGDEIILRTIDIDNVNLKEIGMVIVDIVEYNNISDVMYKLIGELKHNINLMQSKLDTNEIVENRLFGYIDSLDLVYRTLTDAVILGLLANRKGGE